MNDNNQNENYYNNPKATPKSATALYIFALLSIILIIPAILVFGWLVGDSTELMIIAVASVICGSVVSCVIFVALGDLVDSSYTNTVYTKQLLDYVKSNSDNKDNNNPLQ